MTWGEFKKWAEEQSIVDDDEIRYIDFSFAPNNVSRDQVDDGYAVYLEIT